MGNPEIWLLKVIHWEKFISSQIFHYFLISNSHQLNTSTFFSQVTQFFTCKDKGRLDLNIQNPGYWQQAHFLLSSVADHLFAWTLICFKCKPPSLCILFTDVWCEIMLSREMVGDKHGKVTAQKTQRPETLRSTPIFYAMKQSFPNWKTDYNHAGYVKRKQDFFPERENHLVLL